MATESARDVYPRLNPNPRADVLQYSLENGIEFPRDWLDKIVQNVQDDRRREELRRASARPESPPKESGVEDQFRESLRALQSSDIQTAVDLVPRLPEPKEAYVRELLTACRWLGKERQGEVLTRAAPSIPPESRKRLAEELLAKGSDSVGVRCILAGLEAEPARSRSFESVSRRLGSLADAAEREAAILAIVRTCPAPLARRAILSFQKIDDLREQASLIFTLVPYLGDGLPSDLVDYLSNAGVEGKQIATLTRMVSQLSKALQGGVLGDFIKEAARFSSEWWLVEALTLTILCLEERQQIEAVLEAARNLTASDLHARIVGRIAVRLARLGRIEDAVLAIREVPLEIERWRSLTDLAIELAADGYLTEARRVAATIADSEEQSKARATIALHFAARGHVDQARAVASEVEVEHWRELIESRLATLKNGAEVPIVERRRRPPPAASPTDDSTKIDLDLAAKAIEELLRSRSAPRQLEDILAAAQAKNAEEAIQRTRQLWRAQVQGGKTYLEVIAEQPRPFFLKELQKLTPLIGLSCTESEVAELVAGIHEVFGWWP
jgi:hypothetical protein